MEQPEVIPKGYAAKEAQKADYRCSLFAYVRRHTSADGTSGVIRMKIRDTPEVMVNHMVINDDHFQLRPGDVVEVKSDYDGIWDVYTVTAKQIEETWR